MKALTTIIMMVMAMNGLSANSLVYTKYFDGKDSGGAIVTDATERSSTRNRIFIGEVLEKYIKGNERVFEIGTGTADQTIYFCEKFPTIVWQPSDQQSHLPYIKAKLQQSNIPPERLKPPVAFDIDNDNIEDIYNVIYSSNVVHCIPWESAESLFAKAASALKINGLFILYGPYNSKGYTSDGNKTFDAKLRAQDHRLGLREIDEMKKLAQKNDFVFVAKHDHEGVNNYILVFQKIHPPKHL